MKPIIAKDQRQRALANIITGCSVVLFAILVYRIDGVLLFLNRMLRVMLPFTVGFVLAFLLDPPLMALERLLHRFLNARLSKKVRVKTPLLCRLIAAIVVYLLFIGLVFGFLAILLPQLITSMTQLINSITRYINTHRADIEQFMRNFSWTTDTTSSTSLLDSALKIWNEFAASILTNSGTLVVGIYNLSASVSNFLVDMFLGMIVSVYMLFGKERFAAQCKKFGCAVMSAERVKQLTYWFGKTHMVFSGFIAGKMITSIALSLVCYIIMLCCNMDYALLISVIVGVTNIVPVFGPFIGGGIGVIILLVVNPEKQMNAVWFALIILILQQLEGNIIGPKILGDSIGINSFWVIFAIVLGGGLFGLTGILLGIPVFAVIYSFVQMLVESKLKQKGMPPDTQSYHGQGELPSPKKPSDQ